MSADADDATDADADATAGGSAIDATDADNYDAILDDLDVAIAEARRKIESGRVRSPENERVRQGWVKTLAYAVNVRRQCLNDKKLEELDERLSAIEGGGE
ncbi:hypothetical protein [Natrinema marinum]|uniref:hypothetical protein n=1 Tax=Natrinema marinum TaxID=2961598 RepID=UPI0020C84C97|nr:hypothetical protein [Natrinema marinum]